MKKINKEIDEAIDWVLLNVGLGSTILMAIWVLILYMWGPT